jgi:hypothetical protein
MQTEKIVEPCLKEMFKRVGERYPNKKLTDQRNWYSQRAWTKEQEEDFKQWMIKYLMRRRYIKQQAEKEVAYFLLMWGWSTPHDDGTLTQIGKEKQL